MFSPASAADAEGAPALGIRATVNSATGGGAGGSTLAAAESVETLRSAGIARLTEAGSVVDVDAVRVGPGGVGVRAPESAVVGVGDIGLPAEAGDGEETGDELAGDELADEEAIGERSGLADTSMV